MYYENDSCILLINKQTPKLKHRCRTVRR